MILLKRIGNRHYHLPHKLHGSSRFLEYLPQNTPLPFASPKNFNSNEPCSRSSFSWGSLAFSTRSVSKTWGDFVEKSRESEKASWVFSKDDVRPRENIDFLEVQDRDRGNTADMNEELGDLEEGMRSLKKGRLENEVSVKIHSSGKRNLWALFYDKKMKMYVGNEDKIVNRELSFEMQMFAYHLYEEGYFDGASLMPQNKFDSTCFGVRYAREFLKFAALEFGKDHQEIAKWLSASDLKTIALFGCPSLGHMSVTAAKNLRRYFEIKEHEVCQQCRTRKWCKRADTRAPNGATKLSLSDVIRVLVLYGMDSPGGLLIPKEIKDSVSRLLKEVINLSKTVTRSFPRTPF